MWLKEKWMSWVMTIVITIMVMFVFEEAYGCLEEERAALLQLKAQLVDPSTPPDYSLYSWKEDKASNCCHGWEGVKCGPNGRVYSLSVHTGNFDDNKSEFNASILLPFEQLQELDLSWNGITSWMEAKDSKKLSSSLTKLEVLYLGENRLNTSSILKNLSGFQSLKELDLGSNGISGIIPLSDIEALHNLEALYLGDNAIDGFIISHDKASVKQSPRRSKLELLDLSSNYQAPLNMSVVTVLSRFPALRRLFLSASLQLNGVLRLDEFAVFNNLEELDLCFNGIVNISISNAGSKRLSKLKLLDLSYNYLNNNSLASLRDLPSSLTHLSLDGNWYLNETINLNGIMAIKNLKELSLRYNRGISGLTCHNGWKNSSSLESLDFSNNDYYGDIPSCFRNFTSLQTVDLSDNNFNGELPSWLDTWEALRVLDLSGNQFTGDIAESSLTSLQNLQVLNISDNKFRIPLSFKSFINHTKLKFFIGDGNQAILDEAGLDVHPSTFGLQLQVLTLSDCSINGPLPNFLRHQHDLRVVVFTDNSVQGSFPTWLLESNPQLAILLLNSNSLAGPLQLPAFPHTFISKLDISHNKVAGEIPMNVGKLLPSLSWLGMSNNELKGSIPASLHHMHNLSVLLLSDNRLSGGLRSLVNLFGLRAVVISNNNIEEEIPSSLFELPFLLHLNLGGNRLSGTIKDDVIVKSTSFWGLILKNNSLEGPILNWLCGLHGISHLDLSNTNISGPVPSCFRSLSGINELYLNNNRLSGEIDNIFCNMSYLSVLDLGNNLFTGHIPRCISGLFYVSVISLGGNRFVGEIPHQLCELGSLIMLDLSRNNLSGTIPPCLSQITFDKPQFRLTAFGLDTADDVFEDYFDQLIDIDEGTRIDFTTKSNNYDYELYRLDTGDGMSGIDLSCNSLTSRIPIELGNLTKLRSLNLSHNQLWGPIPATISKMKQLESLDLSYNKLSGRIPTAMGGMDFLEVFNFGHNNLSGRMPSQGHFVTFDNASNYEGNPYLCGLLKSCTPVGWPPIDPNKAKDEEDEEDGGWIDMATFYVTFGVTSVIMFVTAFIIMWIINPKWQRTLYYFTKICITSVWYFLEDTITKFKRLRNV